MLIVFMSVLILGVVLAFKWKTKVMKIIGYIILALCAVFLLFLVSNFVVDTKFNVYQIIEETNP